MNADRVRPASLLLIVPAMVLTFCFAGRNAEAARFTIESGASENLVKFDSKAPVESFDGKTRKISGFIEVDPANLGDSVLVSIEVDAASLDTGIALRNRHMRENHLHTEKYPKITFRGATLLPGHPTSLEPGTTATFGVRGTFELHGVQRRIEAPVQVTYTPGEGGGQIRVVAKFQVKLPDYQIPRPQVLVMKLDEVQRITFDVTAMATP